MEKIRAALCIELNVTCPECQYYFDLFRDVPGTNDEGELYQLAMPDSDWSRAHDNFHCHTHCPQCSVEFEVKGIEY